MERYVKGRVSGVMVAKYQGLAPAKINFGLRVLRRREDGYHDLATFFYPLRWADTLHVRTASTLTLACTDPTLDCGDTNLVIRAARALAAATGCACKAAMRLEKHLPIGAGLGGGSSDAATTLRLLSQLWEQRVTDHEMADLALSMGSDVPYFLDPVPAYATGRGENLTPLTGFTLPFAMVVVAPPVHVSTAWAFSRISPTGDQFADLATVVQSCDLSYWQRALVNDFETPVFAAYPQLRAQKERFLDMGAGYASLTGTGAAVYGIFEKLNHARQAAEAAKAEGHAVHLEMADEPQDAREI